MRGPGKRRTVVFVRGSHQYEVVREAVTTWLFLLAFVLFGAVSVAAAEWDTTAKHNVEKVAIGAVCEDGTTSAATGQGACSWHGGVYVWRYREEHKLPPHELREKQKQAANSGFATILLAGGLVMGLLGMLVGGPPIRKKNPPVLAPPAEQRGLTGLASWAAPPPPPFGTSTSLSLPIGLESPPVGLSGFQQAASSDEESGVDIAMEIFDLLDTLDEEYDRGD